MATILDCTALEHFVWSHTMVWFAHLLKSLLIRFIHQQGGPKAEDGVYWELKVSFKNTDKQLQISTALRKKGNGD